ncbi:MAG TPA: aminoglycoside phosphotransferase family protein [Candidatus Acidoferrales bacterium]|nr:aminoglycoside phosphotransferase family protein [Candidatus Acidoferrales bacterium]
MASDRTSELKRSGATGPVATAQEVAREWGLRLGEPYPVRHSFVAPAGDDAVLKVSLPSDDESLFEADALRLWDGRGAPRLLRHDARRRALLIERARPGHDVTDLDDDDALRAALDVARLLWRPAPPSPFERVADRVPTWLAHVAGHPLVAEAQRRYAALTPRDDVLVHGDLHHHNLLRHDVRWIAIDPKPMLGEREYDVVTLLWNPIGHVPDRASVQRRIALFASAGLDASRVRDWAIVRGSYLGFPLRAAGERPQHTVVRILLES